MYDAIIEASGRGKVLNHKVLQAIAVPGSYNSNDLKDLSILSDIATILLKNAATIAWDVYVRDRPIKEATRDVVVNLAKKGGALLEDIVTAAIVTLEIAEATSLFVTGVGFVAGIIGAYIVGEIAGEVFDAIFGSAGTNPVPNKDHIFYVAAMPDGKREARIVA